MDEIQQVSTKYFKNKFCLFHSKKLKPSKLFNLEIDGVSIKQVFTVKYVVVTFDSNLTWKNHINELCSKLQYRSNVSYHLLKRCVAFLARCIAFLARCVSFLSRYVLFLSRHISFHSSLFTFLASALQVVTHKANDKC